MKHWNYSCITNNCTLSHCTAGGRHYRKKKLADNWGWKGVYQVGAVLVWVIYNKIYEERSYMGTTVKWRENGLYAPVAFCVIRSLFSKLQIMLVAEVFDFCGYFSSVLPHSGFYDFANFWVKGLMELQVFRFWIDGLLLFKFLQIYVLPAKGEHSIIEVGKKIASWAIVKPVCFHFLNIE